MKRIALMILAMAGMGLAAGASTDTDRLEKRMIERSDDVLLVDLTFNLSDLRVSSGQAVVYTPLIRRGDSLRVLPQLIVKGRARQIIYDRASREADDVSVAVRRLNGEEQRVDYHARVPYAAWMDRSEMVLVEDDCGCGWQAMGPADETAYAINLAREPRPMMAYVAPKAEVKTRSMSGSAYLDFPVNQTVIYPEYRNNPSELKKIQQTIDVVKNDPDTKITAISIKGYASPEGSYANNTRLAKGRTEALKKYVQELYHFDPSIFTTAYEPEDWEGLERYVEASDLADKEGILDMIAGDEEPDRKYASIKRRYPDTYAFLLKNCYPALRHSDYTVEYIVRSYTDVEEAKRIMKTAPGKLSLQEFYTIANTYESGTPAYNEVFETAVRMYPDDETANLNAANVAMNKRDLTAARNYLEKAGTGKEAEYARGVLAALEGNYAEAQTHLQQAKAMGVSEADNCLKQIEDITK